MKRRYAIRRKPPKTTKKRSRRTADAGRILDRHFGKDGKRRAEIDRAKEEMAIGAQIHAARLHAGLTQAELAKRIGTTQSVISDLEDAEY